jgi:hypothetical protein
VWVIRKIVERAIKDGTNELKIGTTGTLDLFSASQPRFLLRGKKSSRIMIK